MKKIKNRIVTLLFSIFLYENEKNRERGSVTHGLHEIEIDSQFLRVTFILQSYEESVATSTYFL